MVRSVERRLSSQDLAARKRLVSIAGQLGFRLEAQSSRDQTVGRYRVINLGDVPLSEEQLRMFARLVSLGTGRGVEFIGDNPEQLLRVEAVPKNVVIESTRGQGSYLGSIGSRLNFAAARILSLTGGRAITNLAAELQRIASEVGFDEPKVCEGGCAATLVLNESERVFGDQRFCRLLGAVARLAPHSVVIKILAPADSVEVAARAAGGSLISERSAKGPYFVDVCSRGVFDQRSFFQHTGMLGHVIGDEFSKHVVLRDFIATELEAVKHLVRTWWIDSDAFCIHLKGDSYTTEGLRHLGKPLAGLGYKLKVSSGQTRGRGIIASPEPERFFIGSERWMTDLPLIVAQHTGLAVTLKLPGVQGFKGGAPKLILSGCQREYTALVHRAAATIAESMITFPIEVVCRDEEGAKGVDLTELNKIVCLAAPYGLFIHSSKIVDTDNPFVISSVIGGGEILMERVYGDRFRADLKQVMTDVDPRRAVLSDVDVADLKGGGSPHIAAEFARIHRVSANLIRSQLPVVGLISGEITKGIYKVYLPAVSGMGLLATSGSLSYGWRKFKVTGFSKILRCPLVSVSQG